MATVVFAGECGKYADLLDGQHRVGGFENWGAVEFDLPVVALHNVPDQMAGKVFADINSKKRSPMSTCLICTT